MFTNQSTYNIYHYIKIMKYQEYLKGSLRTIILALLRKNGKMYGYEMSQYVSKASSEDVKLTFGALYPVLHKLEMEEFVKTSVEMVNGRARKYYELTKAGKKESKLKSKEFIQYMKMMTSIVQNKKEDQPKGKN